MNFVDIGERLRQQETAELLTAAPTVNLSVASANAVGTSNYFARADHSHAITSSSNPGATAAILSTTAAGCLQLLRLGIGVGCTNNNQIAMVDGASIGIPGNELLTFNAAGTAVFSGCDVGIGAAVAGRHLNVEDSRAGYQGYFYNTNAADGDGLLVRTDYQNAASLILVVENAGVEMVKVLGGAGGAGNVLLAEGANGSMVGIGCVPDSKLEVSSTDDTRIKITDTGDASELVMRSDGANTSIYTNTNHDITLYTAGNANQLFLDQGTGYVGMNIAVPLAQCHIDQSDNAAAIPVLILDQADISEGAINFIASARGAIAGATNSLESVRVELGGVVYRLALFVDA